MPEEDDGDLGAVHESVGSNRDGWCCLVLVINGTITGDKSSCGCGELEMVEEIGVDEKEGKMVSSKTTCRDKKTRFVVGSKHLYALWVRE